MALGPGALIQGGCQGSWAERASEAVTRASASPCHKQDKGTGAAGLAAMVWRATWRTPLGKRRFPARWLSLAHLHRLGGTALVGPFPAPSVGTKRGGQGWLRAGMEYVKPVAAHGHLTCVKWPCPAGHRADSPRLSASGKRLRLPGHKRCPSEPEAPGSHTLNAPLGAPSHCHALHRAEAPSGLRANPAHGTPAPPAISTDLSQRGSPGPLCSFLLPRAPSDLPRAQHPASDPHSPTG